jgi:hypothetical protein
MKMLNKIGAIGLIVVGTLFGTCHFLELFKPENERLLEPKWCIMFTLIGIGIVIFGGIVFKDTIKED